MQHINVTELEEEIQFVKRAAKWFKANPSGATYSDKDIASGCLLAIRWGLDRDGIVVLKVSDTHNPVNYARVINV